jgi:UDP-GlcNAc:undecaprenyl-phosphate GlcNAc-1-phosphate transferase
VLLIALGVQVRVFASAFPGMEPQVANMLDVFVTLLWLVGMTNAFNFVDSMDGLATGIGLVTAIFLSAACVFSGQVSLAFFMAFIVGLTYGLHAYTSAPARLFLGDGGALALGFLLASAAMLYNPRIFPQGSSWFVPIMILGVPIFDATLVVFSRLRRGLHVYRADRNHTYHRLVALGLEPNRAVLAMHVVSVLLGCLAFIAMNQTPLWANIIFAGVLSIGLLLLAFLDGPRVWR